MPISTTTRKAGPFIGSGTASNFPFSFKVFQASDLLVVRADSAGNESNLTLDSDYTVALNANQDSSPGGTVTLSAGPLATNYTLLITSAAAELQQTDLTNAGGFYPEVITNALDLLTILIQQLQGLINQTLTFPVSDTTSPVLPAAAARAGKILSFGADGSISLVAMAPQGASLFSGSLTGTVDGTNKVFTFTNNGSPLGKTPLQATVWQNFPLAPGDGYSLGPGAGQVTFTKAPVSTDTLFAQGSY